MGSITEALSKSTVRIIAGRAGTKEVSIGTAFIMSMNVGTGKKEPVPVLVTNKHVVRGWDYVRFVFSEKCERGQRPNQISVILPTSIWVDHPDSEIDLCAMPIAPVLREADSRHLELDIASLPVQVVSRRDDLKKLRQLDEVVMVGYPDGLMDEVNNQPIFRRGVMATDPFVDYRAKKEFLLDIAAYPGSSGSPVFVVKEGVYYDRERGSAFVASGPSCSLVGVLYAGHTHDVSGHPVSTPIPTSLDIENPWVPNNLGIVIKADQLLEFEKVFQQALAPQPLTPNPQYPTL